MKCLVKNKGFKMFKMMNKYFYIRNFDMKYGKYFFIKFLKKLIKKVDEVGYVFL